MFKCPRCGSIGQSGSICEVCRSRRLDTLLRKLSAPGAPSRVMDRKGGLFGKQSKPFWTGTKIVASTVALLLAVSSVAAGVYYGNARLSSLSCTNGAVNYPSCNSCGSFQTYNTSTHVCNCTDGTVNPPYCNRYCRNNAINSPNCDLCPDRVTDYTGVCPPTG